MTPWLIAGCCALLVGAQVGAYHAAHTRDDVLHALLLVGGSLAGLNALALAAFGAPWL